MSIHLYKAEKKDVEVIAELLINFKDEDLQDMNYPEVDQKKLINFINVMLQKGTIVMLKDLDSFGK